MSKAKILKIISGLFLIVFLNILSPKTASAASCRAWTSALDDEILPGASLTATIQNTDSGKTYRFSLTPLHAGGTPVVSQDAVATGNTLEITITAPTEEREYSYAISELRFDGTPENCPVGGSGFITVTSSARVYSSPSPTATPTSGKNPCGTECETALGNIPTDIGGFAGKILSIAIGLAGGIALILMVIGSIRVLTSSGDQQRLAGGRDMIIAAIAGLLFLIFSVLILKFIGVEIFGTLNPIT